MTITSKLLKLGAAYALARLTSYITKENLQKLASIRVDDLKQIGLDHADTAFGTIGLRRNATVTSSTAYVLGGFLAGTVVGAGALFLFYTEQGSAVRRQVVGFFIRGEHEHKPVDEPVDEPAVAAQDSGGNGNTHGDIRHDNEAVAI